MTGSNGTVVGDAMPISDLHVQVCRGSAGMQVQ
jgi:hypothetical protein